MGGAIKARLGDRKTNCKRQFDDVESCQNLGLTYSEDSNGLTLPSLRVW